MWKKLAPVHRILFTEHACIALVVIIVLSTHVSNIIGIVYSVKVLPQWSQVERRGCGGCCGMGGVVPNYCYKYPLYNEGSKCTICYHPIALKCHADVHRAKLHFLYLSNHASQFSYSVLFCFDFLKGFVCTDMEKCNGGLLVFKV